MKTEKITYKISDITELYSGGDAPSNYSDIRTEKFSVPIYSNGITNEGLYGYTTLAKMPKDSITISARGTVGIVFYRKEDFYPIVRLISVIPKKKFLNSKYFYYYLKGCKIDGFGTSQQQLTIPFFSKYKVNIFKDVTYQQKIADILSKYDDLIENNNKRIKLLEQMAENLYKEWFVRFRFPNYKKTKFIDGFPEDWEIMKLKDFGINLESGSRPKGGIDFSLTDGIPSFGAEVIKSIGEFDYNETKYVPQDYYDKMSKGKNRGNDILLYKDGAYIGKTTIFKYEFPFKNYCINEHVFFIKPNNTIYHDYLYFTLHQKEYFYLMQNLNRNAAQPGLSKEDINRIKINVPNEKIILLFNNFVEPLLKEIFTLAKQNQNLIKQRDLLLPRLMSGKLKV